MTDAWDKLEELREHPELAYTDPEYDLAALRRDADPYAWFLLLAEQPQLAPPSEWWNNLDRLSDLPWGTLLAKQPQFAHHCNWASVSRLELVKLALLSPELFARKFPRGRWQELCPYLTAAEWRCLLRDVPEAVDRLDMDMANEKLSPADWLSLLKIRPQLEKYFDWSRAETCPSVYWYCLLCRQPQFACHCDFSRWEGWQIRELLKKHPQFKTPELERLIEEAEIYEEYREEKDRDPVGDPGDLR